MKLKQMTLEDGFIKNRYVLDIETMNNFEDSMFGFQLVKMGLGYKQNILIGLYDGKTYNQFNSFKECIEFIWSNCELAVVYAHNGGKYDFLYLLEEVIKEYQLENIITLGSNIIFDIRKGDKQIKFRDSFKLMPNSLDKLAKSFGSSTQKIKMNYDGLYCNYEIEKYLEHDCKSLYQIIKSFENEIRNIIKDEKFNIDKFISLASMSFYILNKNYLKGITKNMLPKNVENWCRKAYYGGRTEVFKFHGTNLNYFDVNSLYPFVMKINDFPLGRYAILKDKNKIWKAINIGELGIIKAKIKYPYNYLCCLPYKNDEDKLMFPYGEFIGQWTSIELMQAIYEGAEVEVIEAVFWQFKGKIFNDFVNDFYVLKQNSTGAKREIAKLILNSSYGKFGQKRKYNKIISKKEFVKKSKTNEIDNYDMLGSGLFYSKEEISFKNRKVNPVYAIFVTAYARLYLFNLMKSIGEKHIYYCDTDSIMCDCEINPLLIHDSNIGKLKREVDIINEGIFISPKFYGLDFMKDSKRFKSIKIKGVDRSILKKMSMKDLKSIFENNKFIFKASRMISFNQKFSRLDYKDLDSFVNMNEITKELNCKYDKRIKFGNDTATLKVSL